MKKTTLSKLVKQALYEAFKELRGVVLKGSDTNLEKISLLEKICFGISCFRKGT